MADDKTPVMFGLGGINLTDAKTLGDYTVHVTSEFAMGDTKIPAGDYTMSYDANNPHMVTITSGSQSYTLPNGFTTTGTGSDVKLTDGQEYVSLWTNSYVTDKSGKAAGLPSALLPSNAKLPEGFSYAVADDGKQYIYRTRNLGDVTGYTELSHVTMGSDGKPVQVYNQLPYRPGEKVVVDGKVYTVDAYTANNTEGYNLTLKAQDGTLLETNTQDMAASGAQVVTSEIAAGSTYGYHADERATQEAFAARVGQAGDKAYPLASQPMNVGAMQAENSDKTFLCSVKGADGKTQDAYVMFDGKGGVTIVDKKTGASIDPKNATVTPYEIQSGDHNGFAGSYTSGGTYNRDIPTGAITTGTYTNTNEKGTDYFYYGPQKDYNGRKVVIGQDAKTGKWTVRDAEDELLVLGTYNSEQEVLKDLQGVKPGETKIVSSTGVSDVPKEGDATTEIAYQNNGYQVAGIITDKPEVPTEYTGLGTDLNAQGAIANGGGTSAAVDRSDIYDDAMWQHNINQTSTLPGLGDPSKPPKYANPQAAIGQLVNSGQWSRQDATAHVNDLAAAGLITFESSFAKKEAYYPAYASIHSQFKGTATELKARCDTLRATVTQLIADTDKMRARMESWVGDAADTAARNIRTIQGRLKETSDNIYEALEPACAAIMELDERLTELEQADKVLADLIKAQNTAKTKMDGISQTLRYTAQYEEDPETKEKKETARYKQLQSDLAAAKTAYDEATTAVEEQQKLECELEQVILGLIEKVQSLEQNIKSLSDHVQAGGKFYNSYKDNATFQANFNQLYADFSSFERFPVLTNATDYQVGDYVTFDDGYGYLYRVVEVFNGDGTHSGYIKIQRVDANGNPIGPVLTIWDQREISPVRGEKGRRLWTPPITLPTTNPPTKPNDVTTQPPTQPKPPKPPKPSEPTQPGPGPGPTTKPPTSKPPTSSTPTTKPPTSSTPTTQPPTYVPLPPTFGPTTIPDYDIPTAPPPVYIDDDPGEYIPHTGIDVSVDNMVQGNSEVKQSGMGALGALAGVMAGAAGIGITALTGDKDKDEEEKKEHEEREGHQESSEEQQQI